jgi:diguanylate cyclase (GGDEF)-like protein/PAS domain S-box-containing protein
VHTANKPQTDSRGVEEYFKRIFDFGPQPIGINDASGNVIAVNPAFTRLFGYTREDIPTLEECFKKIFSDEDYRIRATREWKESLHQFKKTGVPSRPLVQRGRKKDGSECIVEVRSTVTSSGENIVFFVDVTEKVQSEERTKLWTSVFEQSAEGIMICDARQNILMVNPSFEYLTGYTEEEVRGKTPRILHSGRQDAPFYETMWKSISETGHWRGEIWNRRKNGEVYVEWLSVSAVLDADGVVSHYIGIFSDITQRKEDERRIVHLAYYDVLTSLPNRLLAMDRLQQLIRSAQRDGSKLAILFIDLDRFKSINDSMGHDAGDELLKTISQRLLERVRKGDTVARMGGDEFVAVLPGLREPEDAAIIAQHLIDRIIQPMVIQGQEISISSSIGIAIFPEDGLDTRDLIRNADAAMYEAKQSGRNSYRFYTRGMNERALEMLSMENALRAGLQRNEFLLHYQPQIDILTGAIIGAEALIRWNRPGFGLVPPGEFIPVAEERGLIGDMGQWVIEEAIRRIIAWNSTELSALPVAVNVSSLQFHKKGFVEHVLTKFLESGVREHRLELELTESLIVKNVQGTIEILHRLHDVGILLSIDDFGTGYSSLNYLRRFPIDKIKIDRSFVQEMADPDTVRVVRGIISLAKSLNLRVIAEGVETREQLEVLRAEGCDEAQGFLFSKPLPPEEFMDLFHQWKDRPLRDFSPS